MLTCSTVYDFSMNILPTRRSSGERRIREALVKADVPRWTEAQPGWSIESYYGAPEVRIRGVKQASSSLEDYMAARRVTDALLQRSQDALVAAGFQADLRTGFVTFDDLGPVAVSVTGTR